MPMETAKILRYTGSDKNPAFTPGRDYYVREGRIETDEGDLVYPNMEMFVEVVEPEHIIVTDYTIIDSEEAYEVQRVDPNGNVYILDNGFTVVLYPGEYMPVTVEETEYIRITRALSDYVIEGKVYAVKEWRLDGPVVIDDLGGSLRITRSEWELVDEEFIDAPFPAEVARDIIADADVARDIITNDLTETVYIAGRMTGIEDYNRARFYEVESVLEDMGYDVINPARLDDELGRDGLEWHDFMKRDISAIMEKADMVVVFDDWQNSRGATDEVYAAFTAGVPVRRFVEIASADEASQYPDAIFSRYGRCALVDDVYLPVPLEAKQTVLGPRRASYGHPADNFALTADLINAMLQPKLKDGEQIDVRDVAMIMIQVKIAREYNAPKRDNMVDVCGYAYAYRETLDELERRGEEDRLAGIFAKARSDYSGSVSKIRKGDVQ